MFPVPYGHIVLKPEYRKRDSSTSSSSSSSSSSDSDRGSKKCHRKNCSKNKDKKKKKKKKEKQTTQVSFLTGSVVPVNQVAPQIYVPSQQQQQQQSNQFPGAVFAHQHSIAAFQLGVQPYGMNGQNPSPMQGYGMNGSNPAPNVIPISFQIPSTQGPTCPCQGNGSSGVPGGVIPGGVQYTTTHQWFQQ